MSATKSCRRVIEKNRQTYTLTLTAE